MKNYYNILGIDQGAQLHLIKKAFRKKALEYHPDTNPSPNAEEQFRLVHEAYSILSNAQLRQKYDLLLKAGVSDDIDFTKASAEPTVDPRYTQGDGRKYGTAYKYKDHQKAYREKVKRETEEDRKQMEWVEILLFYSLFGIGMTAIVFSVVDLLTEKIENVNQFNGLLFSVLFTGLLSFFYFYLFRSKK